jgi:hypothetical protein
MINDFLLSNELIMIFLISIQTYSSSYELASATIFLWII